MFEVHYHNTSADLRAALRALPWRLRWQWTGIFWSILLASAMPAALLALVVGGPEALVGGAVAWAFIVALVWYKLYASRRLAIRAAQRRLRPTTMRIAPEGLEVRTERGHARTDWQTVDEVISARRHLVMVTKALTMQIVPRSAFASPTEAEQFFASAVEYHRQGQESQRSLLVPASMVEAGEGETVQVHYRNTPEEFVRLHFEGLQQSGRPARKVMTWRGALVLIGLGLALAVLVAAGRTSDFALPVSIGMFVLVGGGTYQLLLPVVHRTLRSVYARRCDLESLVAISPRGVSTRDLHGDSQAAWSEFSSIEEDERFIAFFQNERTHVAMLIPRRFFASEAEANRFVGLAKHYWEQAAPQPQSIEAVAESGNPYQSPAAR